MKKNFKIKLIILLTLVFFFSRHVLAAGLELNAERNTLQENEVFMLTVFLNTEGDSINTVEGNLKYDDNFLKAEIVNIGGSFISFWVEKPNLKTLETIHFSGIIPGGISTVKGEVFKIVFRTKKTGDTNLLLNNVNLFLNDGEGSLAPAKIINTNIKIIQGVNAQNTLDLISGDKIFPEKFNIMRSQDSSLFDNKYFIAFSTTDKNSGIDHYQVCELFKCVKAESPFLLKNQTPFYHVKVNAYDMNGNFTSSTLISPWLILLTASLLSVIFIFGFYFYRRYLYNYRI
ncbi:hypothetical protein A3B84_02400 [Candidatus Nomurabacteria bacterium RIFCSPHIGHO2_02_FULL_35_13]|uniref:Cohesin domain-containing protein n=1 Tax=Candidatus Nomurabacteria bacterium RIFCSPHIGHO2_02_FULL_35_13 TaxID=1801748 RepID=A0A1F6VNI0_9BACT|nr:MAG: hypothetical protein A3B84_02400 [Candidatus Nomurabacteria bacterium RIFCSPHIGHO2_02_FULL_35_13]